MIVYDNSSRVIQQNADQALRRLPHEDVEWRHICGGGGLVQTVLVVGPFGLFEVLDFERILVI